MLSDAIDPSKSVPGRVHEHNSQAVRVVYSVSHAHVRRLLVHAMKALSRRWNVDRCTSCCRLVFSCQMLLPSKVLSSSGSTSTLLRTNCKRFLFLIIFVTRTLLLLGEEKCREEILNFINVIFLIFFGD